MNKTPPPSSVGSDLLALANAARSRSYSPYSGHAVASAIRTKSGKIYGGCNIENSSFGATLCAERVAISKAMSEEGPTEITEVLVLTDPKGAENNDPWPPCGMCRQVIAEFCPNPEALPIHLARPDGVRETLTFAALFPRAFSSRNLKRKS